MDVDDNNNADPLLDMDLGSEMSFETNSLTGISVTQVDSQSEVLDSSSSSSVREKPSKRAKEFERIYLNATDEEQKAIDKLLMQRGDNWECMKNKDKFIFLNENLCPVGRFLIEISKDF